MKPPTTLLLFVGALIFFAAGNVRSDASDHRYKEGDSVPLYANKVGPFHNPRYNDLYSSSFSLVFQILDPKLPYIREIDR